MRLLFDENLSHKLVSALSDVFAASTHVRDIGLRSSPDETIWSWAGLHGFVIVTQDDDYVGLALTKGPPPKVIWLNVGNGPWREIEVLLRKHASAILGFGGHADARLLIIKATSIA